MKKIFGYFKGERKIWAFIALIISSTFCNIADPYLNGLLVNSLSEKRFLDMIGFSILIAVVSIALAAMRYGINYIAVSVETSVSKKLESDLCRKTLNIKEAFLKDFKSGELSSIAKDDPSEMLSDCIKVFMAGFGILSSVTVAIYVAFLNFWCFLLYAIFFIIIFAYQKISLKKEQKNKITEKSKNDSAKSIVNQIFRGIADIKILNLKDAILDKYVNILDSEINSQKEKEKTRSGNRLFCNVAYQVYTLFFMLLGVFLLTTNKISIQTFITIYLYRSYMYSLLFDVAEMRSNIVDIKTLAGRINKILSIDENKVESFGNISGTSEKNSIEFSNVTFSYDSGELLKNISLKIHQGEIIGLVGASGSAKTTLIKLLSRQLDPCSGEIYVNGHNINNYSYKGYTDIVSVASQQPFVFSCSIRENLLMVKPNATEAEMWHALEKTRIIGYVKSLKDGLDTVINESLNLSGGQLQRIALARLFLKNTPIIVLDEATAALDNKTQAEITKMIHAESSNHIFVIIAHRIEAIKSANKIIFMKNGKIADEGTHQELLAKNSDYVALTSNK